MPFRRRRNRRNLSSQVKRVMREVAYSTQETKHHRVEDEVDFSTSGVLVELNTVDSQGTASGQFIGQEIRQIGIRLRGKLSQADANNTVRVVVFTPSPAFETALAGGASPTDLFYLPSNWSAIRESNVTKTYMDTNMTLNIASGQNDKIRLVNRWISLKMKKYMIVEGSGPPLTGSDKVYLLLLSDSALPSHPTFEFASTLYYKDA